MKGHALRPSKVHTYPNFTGVTPYPRTELIEKTKIFSSIFITDFYRASLHYKLTFQSNTRHPILQIYSRESWFPRGIISAYLYYHNKL